MMNEILTPEQLAHRWRISEGTLAVWRSIGKGPIYNKISGKVSYSMSDILNYEEQSKVDPTQKKDK